MPRKGFEPWAEDADHLLRWWISGPAHEVFTRYDEAGEIAHFEILFDTDRDQRAYPWRALAGFRVIHDTGPVEPIIDAVLALIADDRVDPEELPWWEEFRTVVTTKSNTDAVSWLDAQRRANLLAFGVPADAIADVTGPS